MKKLLISIFLFSIVFAGYGTTMGTIGNSANVNHFLTNKLAVSSKPEILNFLVNVETFCRSQEQGKNIKSCVQRMTKETIINLFAKKSIGKPQSCLPSGDFCPTAIPSACCSKSCAPTGFDEWLGFCTM